MPVLESCLFRPSSLPSPPSPPNRTNRVCLAGAHQLAVVPLQLMQGSQERPCLHMVFVVLQQGLAAGSRFCGTHRGAQMWTLPDSLDRGQQSHHGRGHMHKLVQCTEPAAQPHSGPRQQFNEGLSGIQLRKAWSIGAVKKSHWLPRQGSDRTPSDMHLRDWGRLMAAKEPCSVPRRVPIGPCLS